MIRFSVFIRVVVALLVCVAAEVPGDAQVQQQGSKLASLLRPLFDRHQGDVAVAVKHLQTGDTFAHNADAVMPTASLIKLPVMVTAYHLAANDKLDLDAMLTLTDADKVPGSGVLTSHFSAGTKLTVRDAIHLMIAFSDNTATNMAVDQIDISATKEHMASLGLRETRLNSKVYGRSTSIDKQRSEMYGLGSTTAAETLKLLELLHTGKLADEANTAAMLDHLNACQENQKLTRYLPGGTKVAHKSGSIASVRCEAGIIYSSSGPIAICVLTANNEDQSWRADNAGNRLCADIGLAVYNYFNPPKANAKESFPTSLAYGATGDMVETLQRTLNARLDPSPQLAVDGDFGPATERAVKRLQQEKGMEATGRVEPETWQHLMPLVTEDPPAPDPQTINSRDLPTQPADPLDGPPFVTCRAWAIMDGHSGELLWSHQPDQLLDFASTTKVMTAYLVCNLADKHPQILHEEITFSTNADQTTGSTAGVRAGELLTAEQTLYGLMLPSGNDAAVALAEHFGDRVALNGTMPPEPKPATPLSNYDAFIEAMNDAAQKLGMQSSGFKNPHGMTAEGHKTTCRDMLKLARAAHAMEILRKIVSTREYGVQVTGSSGYHRNLHWKNTNQLLPIEGYLGVKTGTTQAAGACLISACRRGEKTLLMCILGATSSDARYVDSRNLYRWAWKQMEVAQQ